MAKPVKIEVDRFQCDECGKEFKTENRADTCAGVDRKKKQDHLCNRAGHPNQVLKLNHERSWDYCDLTLLRSCPDCGKTWDQHELDQKDFDRLSKEALQAMWDEIVNKKVVK